MIKKQKLFHFRPSFDVLDVWLENLAKHLSQGRNFSSKIRYDIENFIDPFSSEKLNSPPLAKKCDTRRSTSRSPSPLNKKSDFIVTENDDGVIEPEAIPTPMDTNDSGPNSIIMPMANVSKITNGICFNSSTSNSTHTNSNDNNHIHSCSSFSENDKITDQLPSSNENTHDHCSSFTTVREIPKSPHLSKDFSPNGERLRNSLRFRRQERLQKQRSLRSLASLISQQGSCSWDSGNENSISSANTDDFDSDRGGTNYFNFPKLPVTNVHSVRQIGKNSKPYGEKGFIIHVNESLTLKDVKDLNNCYSDDFDSSCDTSLNYIEPDSLNIIEVENCPKLTETKFISPNILKNSTFEVAQPDNDESFDEIKFSFDEVRDNLNKCKSKLDDLEIGDGKMAKKLTKIKIKPPKVSLNDMLLPAKKINHFDMIVTKSSNMPVSTRLHPVSSTILNTRTSNQKSFIEQPAKKFQNKRNDIQNGITHKMPSKNYCKNTLAFIERISDGINERHQKPVDKTKMANNKKLNNTTAQEILTRKPPAPTSPKKLSTPINRNSDKQKKSNPHSSPTRKRL